MDTNTIRDNIRLAAHEVGVRERRVARLRQYFAAKSGTVMFAAEQVSKARAQARSVGAIVVAPDGLVWANRTVERAYHDGLAGREFRPRKDDQPNGK